MDNASPLSRREALAQAQEALLAWFDAHMRPLPWRRDYDPYRVWISEIMLQQTQMERGVQYFERWMDAFPTLVALAGAPEEEVLKLWEGLGYYARARNLIKAARAVVQERGGAFPASFEELRSLPGIGPYTAAAVASIAFQEDVPCIDANVERILARLLDIDTPVKEKGAQAAIAESARLLLPKGRARAHNQAMMELGALVCAKRPDCPRCPLSPWCLARKRDTAEHRPVKKPGAGPVELVLASGVLLHGGRCFIQKREEDDVWGGLWEFPGGCAEKGERPEKAVVREYLEETGFAVMVLGKYGVLKSTYTNHRITLHFYALAFAGDKPGPAPEAPVLTAASESRWVPVKELAGFAMPSLYRKAADALSGGQWGMLGLLFPKA